MSLFIYIANTKGYIMKTTLFVLTYNEIEGMKAIMPRIKKEWVDEIIVVGDGSTYGTLGYTKGDDM